MPLITACSMLTLSCKPPAAHAGKTQAQDNATRSASCLAGNSRYRIDTKDVGDGVVEFGRG
jgi:hypothetical protein